MYKLEKSSDLPVDKHLLVLSMGHLPPRNDKSIVHQSLDENGQIVERYSKGTVWVDGEPEPFHIVHPYVLSSDNLEDLREAAIKHVNQLIDIVIQDIKDNDVA